MPKNIFHSLLHDLQTNYGLKHGKVSAIEKLALSLYILRNRELNSNAAERFQRYGETVSQFFTDMLHIFAQMGIDTIKPTEGQFEEVPNHIRHDTRYWPHFKQVLIVIATMVLHNYIRRHAWSNDEDFRQFENIPDMPVTSGHFDRSKSSSSNSESDLEIAMLRETIANSLTNQYF
ncbi:hypothetical protein J1N35_037901 [Gossypium stocksii]|uniref:DUF8040 domain-containing protein n=1 Tax=Gossypium stocksii TaxID=47602 RepID=A0A9D3ZM72_9ROSI|nr:hypothetical protein J1N35_037901 [Gossypium stocksii]